MKHFKEIIRVSLPLVASTASYTVLTFTDRMFLSWYSAEAIAASVPAMVLSFAFICFFMGTGQYVNVLIAQFYGASQNDNVARSFWQGVYFSIFAGLVLLLFIPLGNLIIDVSGHSPEVIVQEKLYFDVLMYGAGLVVMVNVLAAYYSGRGRTNVVMYTSFLGAAVNIFLNYILIFGKFGLPEMGIKGAGLATVLANAFIVLFYAIIIFGGKDRRKIPVSRYIGFNWRIFSKLIRFGAPNGFQFFIDVSSFTAFIFLIGLHGDDILAASNIVLSVNMLAFMPIVGFGQATSILVGQYMGRKDQESVVSITWDTIKVAALYGVAVSCTFIAFPEFYLQFFKSDDVVAFAKITEAAIPFFMVLPSFLIADTFAIIIGSALGGAGDTKFKMWFSIFGACALFVPIQFLILRTFNISAIFGWVWLSLYWAIVGFVFWLRFKRGIWRNIDMVGH
ncbi:MAG: MATE family efflux transporter [Proteobacteria bacterium]|nr:MATE family efflux transporter [Pseudomonadota bacterium]